jgi:hypothetical protein
MVGLVAMDSKCLLVVAGAAVLDTDVVEMGGFPAAGVGGPGEIALMTPMLELVELEW